MNVSVKQIQKLDKLAIEKYGVPSIALMENAGRATAQVILQRLRKLRSAKNKVCVVCGVGNNAGDGFVVARHLNNAGVKIDILFIGIEKQFKRDARINYQILKKVKHEIQEGCPAFPENYFSKFDFVVDAIFGVGLNRLIGEPFRSVIEIINQDAKRIVSIDVPSGLDGTTGEIYGTCIKADVTVTFSFAKQGMFKKMGPRHVGKVVVVDIGIPKVIKESIRS